MADIKIVTNDNIEYVISKEIAMMSITIQNMLSDLEVVDAAIPLPAINSPTMNKIIEFCQKELAAEKNHNIFSNMDPKILNDVLMAANYLDIKPLFEICCQKVADLIKEKSVEELREIFGIVNDFTPEEEAKIIEETAWAEED